MHLATAIPKSDHPDDWRTNDRVRREGTRNLLDACKEVGVGTYIQQSIAMLQAHGDAWTDEETPVSPTARTASAVDMEALVTESELEWCILRGGYFYGRGTRSDWRLEQARAGRLMLPGDGAAYLSLIHVSDMAAAVVKAVSLRPRRKLFCVVDNEPVTYRDLSSHLASTIGSARPLSAPATAVPSFRVSNERARQALQWQPHYATYRSGIDVGPA